MKRKVKNRKKVMSIEIRKRKSKRRVSSKHRKNRKLRRVLEVLKVLKEVILVAKMFFDFVKALIHFSSSTSPTPTEAGSFAPYL